MALSWIYGIRNVESDRWYVGQTSSKRGLVWRWMQHRYELRKGSHSCRLLQQAWDECGSDSFEFVLLEIPVDNVTDAEAFWTFELEAIGHGYNTVPPMDAPALGKKWSEESKMVASSCWNATHGHQREAMLVGLHRGIPQSDETKTKLRAAALVRHAAGCYVKSNSSPAARALRAEQMRGNSHAKKKA